MFNCLFKSCYDTASVHSQGSEIFKCVRGSRNSYDFPVAESSYWIAVFLRLNCFHFHQSRTAILKIISGFRVFEFHLFITHNFHNTCESSNWSYSVWEEQYGWSEHGDCFGCLRSNCEQEATRLISCDENQHQDLCCVDQQTVNRDSWE